MMCAYVIWFVPPGAMRQCYSQEFFNFPRMATVTVKLDGATSLAIVPKVEQFCISHSAIGKYLNHLHKFAGQYKVEAHRGGEQWLLTIGVNLIIYLFGGILLSDHSTACRMSRPHRLQFHLIDCGVIFSRFALFYRAVPIFRDRIALAC